MRSGGGKKERCPHPPQRTACSRALALLTLACTGGRISSSGRCSVEGAMLACIGPGRGTAGAKWLSR